MTDTSKITVVVDATFGVRLALPSPLQARCRTLLAQWRHKGQMLVAPTLWRYEVTSSITKSIRLGGLPRAAGEEALSLLEGQDIELLLPDAIQTRRAFEWTLKLGRAAAYDSFYLALAEQLGTTLWTGDRKLVNAVAQPWVRWLDDPSEPVAKLG